MHIKDVILGALKLIFIPVTMWLPEHHDSAMKQCEILDNINPKNKTNQQNSTQTKLSDMVEDYNDIHN